MSASPNGSIITAPGSTIVDASGNSWSIGGPPITAGTYVVGSGLVLLNGKQAGGSSNAALLIYLNGVVSHQNVQGNWYSWVKSTWTAPVANPLFAALVPSAPPAPPAPPTPGVVALASGQSVEVTFPGSAAITIAAS